MFRSNGPHILTILSYYLECIVEKSLQQRGLNQSSNALPAGYEGSTEGIISISVRGKRDLLSAGSDRHAGHVRLLLSTPLLIRQLNYRRPSSAGYGPIGLTLTAACSRQAL
jgi:hypothetical protein